MPSSDDITGFLQACIQVYLWNRKVYAAHSFDQRRIFDLVIYQSRDPALLNYLSEGFKSISSFLRDGSLKQVCAVLLDSDGQVAERLDFSFIGQRRGRDLGSFRLAKDFARAALTRLLRLQLPPCNWSNFSLAFEVDDNSNEADYGDQEEAAGTIVREEPTIGNQNGGGVRSSGVIVPIVSTSDPSLNIRLVARIQTRLLSTWCLLNMLECYILLVWYDW